VIADTSGLLALFNAREPAHAPVRAAVAATEEPLVVSPYVIAELDYLVATRLGLAAETAVLEELSAGAYTLAVIDGVALAAALAVIRRYPDQQIGVADASVVVLADRHRTRSLLTLDRRHFDVLRPLSGGRFTIMP
jgi:predicted nucleic acid-binding protein